MREIKFRGWSKELNKWVYGYFFIDKSRVVESYNILTGKLNASGFMETYEVVPESVGQFTGIKDANGADIYEGDILRIDSAISGAEGLGAGFIFINLLLPVIWDNRGFWNFDAENESRFSDYYNPKEIYNQRNFRRHARDIMFGEEIAYICGNTFENPELLEKRND